MRHPTFAIVRELSLKEVADQFEMRMALEVFVVQAIAGKLRENQQSLFEKNLALQTTAATKDNVARLVELDADFHWLMCEVFGNQAIVECMRLQRAKIHRIIFQVMSGSPGRLSTPAWLIAIATCSRVFGVKLRQRPPAMITCERWS